MGKINKTLLIGDKENPVRTELEAALRDQNILVLTSQTREEALKVINEKDINFLFVAPLSKRQDTLDLLRDLRANSRVNHLPAIILSSYYPSPSVSKMTSTFRNARYLVWPYPKSELFKTIEELLP